MWARGYATEATRAVIDFVFNSEVTRQIDRLELWIHEGMFVWCSLDYIRLPPEAESAYLFFRVAFVLHSCCLVRLRQRGFP